MRKTNDLIHPSGWKVRKIGVVGPGIVGMPMAAMLAGSSIRIGLSEPAKVVVVQRNSESSGWKVDAINRGESVIGGIEPDLDLIVHNAVQNGLLSATHDFNELADADVILVSVQTDKDGFGPDYKPLFGALDSIAKALTRKPEGHIPLIVFESTLAPSTMTTLIKKHFENYGLVEGKDILLGNSPNRVMPGRLVERIKSSDKLVGGLSPLTSGLISELYKNVVSEGTLLRTNSLTAEIVKTLENAYRDVRIAFTSEIARYCDVHDIDFYILRDEVNKVLSEVDDATADPNCVPTGGLLIPTLGVGGHCLPKDGILLWWRALEKGMDKSTSIILNSRTINDASPIETYRRAELLFGNLKGMKIALLGVAYRFNSEDTRNSPTLFLANHLRELGINYIMHDPYVKSDDQNLLKFNQQNSFTRDLDDALENAEIAFTCTSHRAYSEASDKIFSGSGIKGVMDACNLYQREQFRNYNITYGGIGRGVQKPSEELLEFVHASFNAVVTGLANELYWLINFFNENYITDKHNEVSFNVVQALARTCSTGCVIADPGRVISIPEHEGFYSHLAKCAFESEKNLNPQ